MNRLLPVALLACLASGCATVDYVGESYQATTHIDMFFAEKDVPREYKVIGQVTAAGGQFTSASALNRKMLERAREKGADGVIILEIASKPMQASNDITETTTISNDEDGKTIKKTASQSTPAYQQVIKALFIRYK